MNIRLLFTTALLSVPLVLGTTSGAQAFLVNHDNETATVATAFDTSKGNGTCTAQPGTNVSVLGTPGGLGSDNSGSRVSIRVLDGDCAGFEASVPQSLLSDFEFHSDE